MALRNKFQQALHRVIWSVSVQLQMVIFDFKEEATGTKHVSIATSKCVPSGIFRRL